MAGRHAALLLEVLELLYIKGPRYFFTVLSAAFRVCNALGFHMPRRDAARAIEDAAGENSGDTGLHEVLEQYATHIAATTYAAPRIVRGLFVMTAHQSKGKEFDAVVLVNANARNFPDRDEARRLFYVAITRATTRWTVIAPGDSPSPLLRHL